MYVLILLIFVASSVINCTHGNQILRQLNSKINLMKSTFQIEIDDLKFTVVDLSTKLELERHRTSELEKFMNMTVLNDFIDDSEGSTKPMVMQKVLVKLLKQEEQLKQLEEELKDEKSKRLTLDTTVDSIKEDLVSAKSLKEETNELKTTVDQFTFTMKSAFKDEKLLLRGLSHSVKSDNKIFEQSVMSKLNAITSGTNTSLEIMNEKAASLQKEIVYVEELAQQTDQIMQNEIFSLQQELKEAIQGVEQSTENDIYNLQRKAVEVEESLQSVQDNLQQLTATVELLNTGVNANENLLKILSVSGIVICEGTSKTIDCSGRSGTVLNIVNANYGRTRADICDNYNNSNTNCRASSSLSIVRRRCENKFSCGLSANNRLFGDPCGGIHKYLEVSYQCRPSGG